MPERAATQHRRALGHAAPWRCAVAVVLLVLALQAGGDAWQLALRFERSPLMHGEQLWRIVTGHLVHLGWVHALLNACGLLLCCALAPARFTPRRLALDVLWLAVVISSLLLALSPEVTYYMGLSGVLYGLFVCGLVPSALRGERIAGAALFIVLGWMAWQSIAGPSAAEEQQIGGRIVASAHVYGAAAAGLLLAGEAAWRRRLGGRFA
ncbi:MAG: rhombosortase [Pseudomonadota bacterium]